MSILQEIGIRSLLLLAFLHGAFSASLQAEKSSETVTITLYRVEESEWASKTDAFKTNVVDQANRFCEESPLSCGLLYWEPTALFVMSSVSENTEAYGNDLEVTFSVTYPVGANVSSVSRTKFVLNKVALKTITMNIRIDIEQAVDAYVTYIDEDYYGIPPDNLANRTIIPIAFCVLFAVIITAIALHVWNKRKTKRERRKEINESKVTPIKGGTLGKNIDNDQNLKGSNVNNAQKNVHEKQKVTPTHGAHSNLAHSTRSVNEFTVEDETQLKDTPPTSLPPLPNEETESERKERRQKKKKKKKKHRHHDSEETNQSQDHDNPVFYNDSDQ